MSNTIETRVLTKVRIRGMRNKVQYEAKAEDSDILLHNPIIKDVVRVLVILLLASTGLCCTLHKKNKMSRVEMKVYKCTNCVLDGLS